MWILEQILSEKPNLPIDPTDDVETALKIADLLSASPDIFTMSGDLVRVVVSSGTPQIVPLDAHSVVYAIHEKCRPVVLKGRTDTEDVYVPTRLPLSAARLFVDYSDRSPFKELRGLAHTPLVRRNGQIDAEVGYDSISRKFVHLTGTFPMLSELFHDKNMASKNLDIIRNLFSEFPYADSPITFYSSRQSAVDLTKPPGLDESIFLMSLFTMVARPSLPLAPGIAIRAPSISGSGTGKGLAVRALSECAYGRQPCAMTGGRDGAEFDHRLAAGLLGQEPVLFIDNLNDRTLKSDLLAQVLSETTVSTRPLGRTKISQLNTNGVIIVTGNGLRLSEDLVSRFLVIDFDTHTDNAHGRIFEFPDQKFLKIMHTAHHLITAAALDIMSWGIRENVPKGPPMRGYSEWARIVRDPLVALGCRDPTEKCSEIMEEDPVRDIIADFFRSWGEHHGSSPVTAKSIAPEVLAVADLSARNRQRVAQFVSNLVNTRAVGYRMTRVRHGTWGASEYALVPARA